MGCTNCNNNQAETNTNYLPDPCETGCVEIVKSGCVTYGGSTTSCLGITSGTNLSAILQAIDSAICLLSEDRFADYEFGCLEPLNISTEQNFAEKIAELLCKILGAESVTTPVSLSTLKTSIQSINSVLNTQTIISCYQTLGELGTTASLITLLESIQSTLCSLNTRLVSVEANPALQGKSKVSATDTNPNFLQNKVLAGEMLSSDIINLGANEQISMRFDFDAFILYLQNNPAAAATLYSTITP
jgi:hypothetical protein